MNSHISGVANKNEFYLEMVPWYLRTEDALLDIFLDYVSGLFTWTPLSLSLCLFHARLSFVDVQRPGTIRHRFHSILDSLFLLEPRVKKIRVKGIGRLTARERHGQRLFSSSTWTCCATVGESNQGNLARPSGNRNGQTGGYEHLEQFGPCTRERSSCLCFVTKFLGKLVLVQVLLDVHYYYDVATGKTLMEWEQMRKPVLAWESGREK